MAALLELDCIHQKLPGLLIVAEELLIFAVNEEIIFECSWLELEKDSYTPDNDSRAMARITLKKDLTKHYVFNFKSKDEMNQLKRLVRRLRPASTASSSSEGLNSRGKVISRIRHDLLSNDSKLRRQYSELVEAGILLEEEFWAGLDSAHQLLIDQKESEAANVKGKTSAILSDFISESDISHIENSEKKQHIFEMYPAVKEAFGDFVPLQMSESEFWSKYLKSDYFRKVTDSHTHCLPA